MAYQNKLLTAKKVFGSQNAIKGTPPPIKVMIIIPNFVASSAFYDKMNVVSLIPNNKSLHHVLFDNELLLTEVRTKISKMPNTTNSTHMTKHLFEEPCH